MKQRLFMLLTIAILVWGCGQKKKETEKVATPAPAEEIESVPILYLPPFQTLFTTLNVLETSAFDAALQEEELLPGKDIYISAYALGALTAKAIIATKSRSKSMLKKYASQMIDYSNLIGIHDEILKLADELNEQIKNDDWVTLEKTLDKYKVKVEANLHGMSDYDTLTILQVGGWTEGLNRICYILTNNYEQELTQVINQRAFVNSMIDNMGKFIDESLYEQKFVKTAQKNYKEIKTILYSGETYSKEQVEKLLKLTEDIKKSIRG